MTIDVRASILFVLKRHPIDPKNGYFGPYEATQDGMSEVTELSRSVISKNLLKMECDGLVDKTRLHTKNKKGRVNVYHLTTRGWMEVEAIE